MHQATPGVHSLWGCPTDKAKADRRIYPGITKCKFLKAAGYEVKRVQAASATDTVPADKTDEEANDNNEPAAVPAAATGSVSSVDFELTPGKWSFKDNELDETVWTVDTGC